MATTTKKNYFTELMNLDLSNKVKVKEKEKEKVKEKDGLSYLPWAAAWAAVKEVRPDANYKIERNEQGFPYFYDPLAGYMVSTSVTIGEITHEMFLPVMDHKNDAMKGEPYTYKVKNKYFQYARWDQERQAFIDRYGNVQEEFREIKVEAATSTDINKAIMRCLVKCLAMHGVGISLYCGEPMGAPKGAANDAPPARSEAPFPEEPSPVLATETERKKFFAAAEKAGRDTTEVMEEAGWTSGKMTKEHYKAAMSILEKGNK